jgi:nucleoside-diphosphate-sugar epimerase
MNVLVCGSEGYLGCVLWRRLKAAGHNVRGIDRGMYGVRNRDDDFFHRADAVINLAALVGEPVCMANPTLTRDYNVTWAAEQADDAIRSGVKTFVQISTCSVYGEQPADVTVDVNTTIASPEVLPPYAASKVLVERELMAREFDSTALRIVRLGTLCGPSPRMRFDLMANGFCLSASRSGGVTIYNPDSVRPHVSVDSVARMLVYLVEHPEEVDVLSVYVGEQHTVRDLAEMACNAARTRRLVVDDSRAIDDRRSYRVRCSPCYDHIPDGVHAAMGQVVRGLLAYNWLGARPDSPQWGNTGWRWEDA